MEFALGLLIFVLIIVIMYCIERFFYSYRIDDKSIKVRIFGIIPVYTLQLEAVEDIKRVSLTDLWHIDIFFSLTLMNMYTHNFVLIQKKTGLFRKVLITPDNADDFIEIVRQKNANIATNSTRSLHASLKNEQRYVSVLLKNCSFDRCTTLGN